jgi:hypothetical protein
MSHHQSLLNVSPPTRPTLAGNLGQASLFGGNDSCQHESGISRRRSSSSIHTCHHFPIMCKPRTINCNLALPPRRHQFLPRKSSKQLDAATLGATMTQSTSLFTARRALSDESCFIPSESTLAPSNGKKTSHVTPITIESAPIPTSIPIESFLHRSILPSIDISPPFL